MNDLLLMQASKLKVFDGANRANTTTGLGTADTGQPWTNTTIIAGVNLIISSNKIKRNSIMGTGFAWLDNPLLDRKVTVRNITKYASEIVGILLKTDSTSDNRIYVNLTDTAIVLKKGVAGTHTDIASYAYAWADGATHTVSIQSVGDVLTVFLDGIPFASATDNSHQTLTKCGLVVYSAVATANSTIDEFVLEAV